MRPLTADYQCPDCGATILSKPVECCDTCILKFYFDNPNASSLADWHEPGFTHDKEPSFDTSDITYTVTKLDEWSMDKWEEIVEAIENTVAVLGEEDDE